MLKYFMEKLISIKDEYLSRSPKGKWMFVLKIGINAQKALGIAILDPKFEVWWYSYTSGVVFLDYVISFIYTIWHYANQPLTGLMGIALVGVSVPPIILFIMIFNPSKREVLRSLIHFPGWTLYPDFNEEISRKYFMICERRARKLLLSTIQQVIIILLSNSLFLIMPGIALVLYNEIQLPVPVLFPFTDLESVNGLIINMLHQGFLGLTAVVGLIGIETTTCMMKDAMGMCVEAICFSIDEISEKIMVPEAYPISHIDQYFRNILMQAQDFDGFILGIHRLFRGRLFLQPALSAFSIAMALFFYLYGVWTSGLAVVLLSFIQLYIQCDYGEAVKTSNKVILLKLHEMPWYSMSIKNQLAFGHLINRLQNGVEFRMGPLDELNFETLSNLTKRIYTFVMMLLRTLG